MILILNQTNYIIRSLYKNTTYNYNNYNNNNNNINNRYNNNKKMKKNVAVSVVAMMTCIITICFCCYCCNAFTTTTTTILPTTSVKRTTQSFRIKATPKSSIRSSSSRMVGNRSFLSSSSLSLSLSSLQHSPPNRRIRRRRKSFFFHSREQQYQHNRLLSTTTTTTTSKITTTTTTTALYYKDKEDDNEDDNNNKNNEDEKQQQSSSSEQQQQSQQQQQQQEDEFFFSTMIPIIGPIPNFVPLILGQSYVLQKPTPMQWNTFQEALAIYKNGKSIHHAPLIGILDQYTSSTNNNNNNKHGRYATIVAIVGMQGTSSNSNTNTNDQDTTTTMTSTTPLDSNIRLLCVGRAVIDQFVYQISTANMEQRTDGDGHIVLLNEHKQIQKTKEQLGYYHAASSTNYIKSTTDDDEEESDNENEDDDDDDDEHESLTNEQNIIMGQFRLINDMNIHTKNVSPIHAINQMSSLAIQIQSIHEQRKELVRGIIAARARLDSIEREKMDFEEMTIIHDYDGIGALFFSDEQQQQQQQYYYEQEEQEEIIVDVFQSLSSPSSSTKKGDEEENRMMMDHTSKEWIIDPNSETHSPNHVDIDNNNDNNNSIEQENNNKKNKKEPSILSTNYVNYGLGNTAASFSNISAMTTVKLEVLEPYYSLSRRNTEEYYYEIYSFVALDAIMGWITPEHISYAVTCCNTIERLQHIIIWMTSHINALNYEAYIVSQELIDCGEQCTDLW